MDNIGIIYFSGTGNTRYVANGIYQGLSVSNKTIMSIEEGIDAVKWSRELDTIVMLYPICGGNIPRIMREYIRRNEFAFSGKTLITIATEAGFSGDGGILAYRMLDSSKVRYGGSYHIIMPTNVSFGKIFKIRNGEALRPRMAKVDKHIKEIVRDIERGKCKRTGSHYISYLIGYHLQRKYFDRIEAKLSRKFAVDSSTCVLCGRCVSICPMHNISVCDGRVIGNDNCTLCYRCLHACPTNSISLIGHEPVQYKGVGNGL